MLQILSLTDLRMLIRTDLRPDCLDGGEQEVVVEGEGAPDLRPDQPQDREPPEAVHGAHLGRHTSSSRLPGRKKCPADSIK